MVREEESSRRETRDLARRSPSLLIVLTDREPEMGQRP